MKALLQFLQVHGGDVCVFVALAAVALQSDVQLPASVLHFVIDAGVLAKAAHRTFWPPGPQGAAPSQSPTQNPGASGASPSPFPTQPAQPDLSTGAKT
jgi:hypothetical protein